MTSFNNSIVGGFSLKPKEEKLEIIYSEGPECEKCGGSGVYMDVTNGPDGPIYTDETCRDCNGEGFIVEDACETCKGDGNVMETVGHGAFEYEEEVPCPDCLGGV